MHSAGHSKWTDLQIRNVTFVNGEIKIVKCLVNNIQVDVSFRQVRGPWTRLTPQTSSIAVSLLVEAADHHFGHNHVFKRSVLLIKVRSIEFNTNKSRHGVSMKVVGTAQRLSLARISMACRPTP